MNVTSFPLELLAWVGVIVIGLPLLTLILGELIERLEPKNNPLASGLRTMRHVTLPLFAIFILGQRIIQYTAATNLFIILETIAWITFVYAAFQFMSGVTEMANRPDSWLAAFPGIFFTACRTLIALFVLSHIVSDIWQIDISNLFTAVGVGALAVSLALQSTVGSVVSGLLLMADRPFRPGDWILYGGSFYLVEEISWRSTRIRARNNSLMIVPNGVLSSEAICNYGSSGTPFRMQMSIDYSDDYAPNYVMGILSELLSNVERIRDEPERYVKINRYDDSVIVYDMVFWIDFADYFAIQTEIHNKLFYIAKRHDLPRPSPVRIHQVHQMDDTDGPIKEPVPLDLLHRIPLFNMLGEAAFHELADQSTLYNYGRGEYIIEQGDVDENLYIIQQGRLSLLIVNSEAHHQPSIDLTVGDVFGGMSLFYDEESSVSALVLDDVEVIQLSSQALSHLLGTQPKFATALNHHVERRQHRLANLTNPQQMSHQLTAQPGWLASIGGE